MGKWWQKFRKAAKFVVKQGAKYLNCVTGGATGALYHVGDGFHKACKGRTKEMAKSFANAATCIVTVGGVFTLSQLMKIEAEEWGEQLLKPTQQSNGAPVPLPLPMYAMNSNYDDDEKGDAYADNDAEKEKAFDAKYEKATNHMLQHGKKMVEAFEHAGKYGKEMIRVMYDPIKYHQDGFKAADINKDGKIDLDELTILGFFSFHLVFGIIAPNTKLALNEHTLDLTKQWVNAVIMLLFEEEDKDSLDETEFLSFCVFLHLSVGDALHMH